MSLKNIGITAYTWATKPIIANWPTYRPIIITDVGVGGSMWYHDTVNWRPVGGSFVLCSYAGSITNPLATLTGVTAAKFALPGGDKPIPADLLISGSSIVHAKMRVRKDQNTAGVYSAMRLGTAGTTGDVVMVQKQFASSVNADNRLEGSALVDTTTRIQMDGLMSDVSHAGASGWADTTTNINTAAAMYVTPQIHSGNIANTYSLYGFEVRITV